MSTWKRRPDQSGVYYVKVNNQNNRYWRYISDGEYWIKLEKLRSGDDTFKWRLNKLSSGKWQITPFTNSSIGFGASPTQWPNGNGIYWYHGFAQGKRGRSANWNIKTSNASKWSTISIDSDVLDSRMSGGRDAAGCVHFYGLNDGDATNQHWVFRRVDNVRNNTVNNNEEVDDNDDDEDNDDSDDVDD